MLVLISIKFSFAWTLGAHSLKPWFSVWYIALFILAKFVLKHSKSDVVWRTMLPRHTWISFSQPDTSVSLWFFLLVRFVDKLLSWRNLKQPHKWTWWDHPNPCYLCAWTFDSLREVKRHVSYDHLFSTALTFSLRVFYTF